jgi:hypothetical protein
MTFSDELRFHLIGGTLSRMLAITLAGKLREYYRDLLLPRKAGLSNEIPK